MSYSSAIIGLATALCLGGAQADRSDLSKYLTPDRKLTAPLTFQDAQAGVVGRAGIEVEIRPSGEWTRTRFWGKKKRVELARGVLTAEQLKAIAERLAAEGLEGLPKEFGDTDPTDNPNPHYMMISFIDVKRELSLPARTELSEYERTVSDDRKEPIRRLAAIIGAINKFTSDKDDKEEKK